MNQDEIHPVTCNVDLPQQISHKYIRVIWKR